MSTVERAVTVILAAMFVERVAALATMHPIS